MLAALVDLAPPTSEFRATTLPLRSEYDTPHVVDVDVVCQRSLTCLRIDRYGLGCLGAFFSCPGFAGVINANNPNRQEGDEFWVRLMMIGIGHTYMSSMELDI